jgi:hypothetical protein
MTNVGRCIPGQGRYCHFCPGSSQGPAYSRQQLRGTAVKYSNTRSYERPEAPRRRPLTPRHASSDQTAQVSHRRDHWFDPSIAHSRTAWSEARQGASEQWPFACLGILASTRASGRQCGPAGPHPGGCPGLQSRLPSRIDHPCTLPRPLVEYKHVIKLSIVAGAPRRSGATYALQDRQDLARPRGLARWSDRRTCGRHP